MANYIRQVRTLAVALGVGAAVATGHGFGAGLARADTESAAANASSAPPTPVSDKPSNGVGPCSSTCEVGGLGQGSESSGGTAKASYRIGAGRVPGVRVRSAGTEASGRLVLGGAVEGNLSGTFHGDSFWGHTTGTEFGTAAASALPSRL
jgi:hypothetical protein